MKYQYLATLEVWDQLGYLLLLRLLKFSRQN